jgi:3-phytase
LAGSLVPAGAVATPATGFAAATVETPRTFNDDAGGNVDSDDPEVWIHPDDTDDSVVIGAEKQHGLSVFDLDGHRIQHIPAAGPPRPGDEAGRLNNLDVLYDVRIAGHDRDIAVVSDRGLDKLHVYSIDADKAEDREPPLTEITEAGSPYLFSADQDEVNDQDTAYGIAAWKASNGTVYVLVTREHRADIGLFKLVPRANGEVGYEVVRRAAMPTSFALPNGTTWTPCDEPGRQPQSEGMVVDEDRGLVYISQEGVGVWRANANLVSFAPVLVDKVREFGVPATYDAASDECVAGPDPGYGGTHLSADAEGLTIYHRADGKGYLIASSQGDSTYAVYDRKPGNAYLGSFRVGGGPIDPTENTDSLFVTNVPVGDFEHGLLLVQDGHDTPDVLGPDGRVRESTNFKLVPWENVATSFSSPLKIDTDGFDPRG